MFFFSSLPYFWHHTELSYYLCNLGIQKSQVSKEQDDSGLLQGLLILNEQRNLPSHVSL